MSRRAVPLLLLAATVSLGAEELFTPGEQVLRELAAALTEGSDPDAARLVEEAGLILHWPASRGERARLWKAICDATRHASAAVRCAGLRALGESGDPGAAAFVEPFLRDLKTAPGAETVMLAAVQAAGRLRPRELLVPLAKLAQKSAHATIADQAFLALGEWSLESPALRRQAVEKVLAAANAIRRKRGRWTRLRAPALRALQRLVGRNLNSYEMFVEWWKLVKTRRDPFAVG